MTHTYKVVEIFTSIQGEGMFTGYPMRFVRFVGCSVGKTVCHHCDTDFSRPNSWLGGGEFGAEALASRIATYPRICFTGGEPLDQDLVYLLDVVEHVRQATGIGTELCAHIETSGTISIPDALRWCHVAVSPKPGYRMDCIHRADEIKVIMGGLGNGPGWPTLEDALTWATELRKEVYLQPCNAKLSVDPASLSAAMALVTAHPQLRLSPQLHKLINMR
jgi:7-carboxy-7-deazaguanine synthase